MESAEVKYNEIVKVDKEGKPVEFDILLNGLDLPDGWVFGWADSNPEEGFYKPIWNDETNAWVETATWFEKLGFESEEEAHLHIAQAELDAMVPTTEERIAMLEEVVIFLTMEGLEG